MDEMGAKMKVMVCILLALIPLSEAQGREYDIGQLRGNKRLAMEQQSGQQFGNAAGSTLYEQLWNAGPVQTQQQQQESQFDFTQSQQQPQTDVQYLNHNNVYAQQTQQIASTPEHREPIQDTQQQSSRSLQASDLQFQAIPLQSQRLLAQRSSQRDGRTSQPMQGQYTGALRHQSLVQNTNRQPLQEMSELKYTRNQLVDNQYGQIAKPQRNEVQTTVRQVDWIRKQSQKLFPQSHAVPAARGFRQVKASQHVQEQRYMGVLRQPQFENRHPQMIPKQKYTQDQLVHNQNRQAARPQRDEVLMADRELEITQPQNQMLFPQNPSQHTGRVRQVQQIVSSTELEQVYHPKSQESLSQVQHQLQQTVSQDPQEINPLMIEREIIPLRRAVEGSGAPTPPVLTTAPPTPLPTVAPTPSPTTALSTPGPTTAQPTPNPTTATPTPPPTAPPTPSPTTAKPTPSPTTAKPTPNPTTAPPTPSPTTAKPTPSPTTAKPTPSPTTAQPTLSPTTAQPTLPLTPSPTYGPTLPAFLPSGANAYGNTHVQTGPWKECVGWEGEDCKAYLETVVLDQLRIIIVPGQLAGEYNRHRVKVYTSVEGLVIRRPERG